MSTKLTEPQRDLLQYMDGYNGRMVMARYGKPVHGDYGPTIRRLHKRGLIARTCSANGFPFFNITDAGRATLAANESQGDSDA